MIIAIWGASATAKTTLAQLIAAKLDIPLRSCGTEVRLAAIEADAPLTDAPDTLHRAVDLATRDWVQRHVARGAVLEGRFLDQVLEDVPGITFVRTVCDAETRVERWRERRREDFDFNDLFEIDKMDDLFRCRMYGTSETGRAAITLETSSGEADNWAEAIVRQVAR